MSLNFTLIYMKEQAIMAQANPRIVSYLTDELYRVAPSPEEDPASSEIMELKRDGVYQIHYDGPNGLCIEEFNCLFPRVCRCVRVAPTISIVKGGSMYLQRPVCITCYFGTSGGYIIESESESESDS
jgi:hypothetical protein